MNLCFKNAKTRLTYVNFGKYAFDRFWYVPAISACCFTSHSVQSLHMNPLLTYRTLLPSHTYFNDVMNWCDKKYLPGGDSVVISLLVTRANVARVSGLFVISDSGLIFGYDRVLVPYASTGIFCTFEDMSEPLVLLVSESSSPVMNTHVVLCCIILNSNFNVPSLSSILWSCECMPRL